MSFVIFKRATRGAVVIQSDHVVSVEHGTRGTSLIRSYIWYNGGDREDLVIGEPSDIQDRFGIA